MRISILTLLLGFATLSGCVFPGVYKLNVQQGNIVTADMRHMAEVEAKREATRIARAAEETPRSEPRPTGDLPASGEADGPVPGEHADATGEADPRATAGDEPPGSSDGAPPPDDPTRMKS